jgi:predicted metal-dependent HD superfamily phosphohydrolase
MQSEVFTRADIAAILRALLSTARQYHADEYYQRGFAAAIVAVATALHISMSDLRE